MCRAWMGARLPFRNTYHKGMYPFLGQTHYYAPDKNNGLFRWADHHPTVTFSLRPLERSPPPPPPPPHVSYSSPSMFIFYALYAVIILCFCFSFHFTLPRVHFQSARIHLATLFSHLQQRVISTLNCTQISCFIPLQPPFYNTCFANYSSFINSSIHTVTTSTTQYNSFLFTCIHINAHLPASLPSTQSLFPPKPTNQPTNQPTIALGSKYL